MSLPARGFGTTPGCGDELRMPAHSDKDSPRRRQSTLLKGVSRAATLIPPNPTLAILRSAAAKCTACDLYKNATQTVFGEGADSGVIMLVGEQPGDAEDKAGHPFVGPAGKLLDEALRQAGIDRSRAYVTNVVKHFKWEASERGKRRIHKKPRYAEIKACRPWLDAELKVVKPDVLVCLGATAAQALLGKDFSVTRDRGNFQPSDLAPRVMATVHPSSILRAPDSQARQAQMQALVRDLAKAAAVLTMRRKSKTPSAA